MKTVQEIAKQLNKAGLKKAGFSRVNFQNVPTGNYEARHLKIYGLNCITILPKNGTTCEEIQLILKNENATIEKGYVVIK